MHITLSSLAKALSTILGHVLLADNHKEFDPDMSLDLKVSSDTRLIQSGDLYVAIVGERFDGNDFVDEALNKGASVIIANRVSAGVAVPAFIVQDTIAALRAVAMLVRDTLTAKVIAVTGSVGKTSTKDMLRLFLASYGQCDGTMLNFNNHIGLPTTIANINQYAEYVVLEMGMNHAGELSNLANVARPDVAIITAVYNNHLANFNNEHAIANAKSEIFVGIKRGGCAVLNRDNRFYGVLVNNARKRGAKIISFGHHKRAHVRLISHNNGNVTVAIPDGRMLSYTMQAVGEHIVFNSIISIAVALSLNLEPYTGCKALSQFYLRAGKGETVTLSIGRGRNIILIDESYSSSPIALDANLDRFFSLPGRRHIVILADMVELGPNTAAEHMKFLDRLRLCSLLITVGPLFGAMCDSFNGASKQKFDTVKELLSQMPDFIDGDIVLVKGSHIWNMARVVDAIKALSIN